MGATRRQVFGGMLLESLIVGLIASAAGVVAGLGLGWGLERLFTAFGASIPSGPLVLAPSTVAIAMATGTAVTLASALLPAGRPPASRPSRRSAASTSSQPSARIGWLRAAVAASSPPRPAAHGPSGTQRGASFIEITAGGLLCFVAVLALGRLHRPADGRVLRVAAR